MPEGPSIVILKEEVAAFTGKKITRVSGNSKLDLARLKNQKVVAFKTWGKHFLICFDDFTVRIHFLMFGSYRINEKKGPPERLSLGFAKGEINFYSCSVKFLEGDTDDHYDWRVDVMNDNWDPKNAVKNLKKKPERLICDSLLEQDVFAGVGNIIKNEVLYRVYVHPGSQTGKIPAKKMKESVDQARIYSFDFLTWKKQFVLKKNWLAHTKKTCLRCDLPIIKSYMGDKNRRTFYCEGCQVLYGEMPEVRKSKIVTVPKVKAKRKISKEQKPSEKPMRKKKSGGSGVRGRVPRG